MTGLTVECKGSPQQIRKMFNFLTPPPPQTDCLASIDCPVVRVIGATTGDCDGEYRLDNTASYIFPRYTHVTLHTSLYIDRLNDMKWKIGRAGNWKIHSATGETSDLCGLKGFHGFQSGFVL